MKILLLFKKLIFDLYSSIKRFPVAIFFSVATAVLFIILNHSSDIFLNDVTNLLQRITMLTALGIPLSLCARLLSENERIKKIFPNSIVIYLFTLVLLVPYRQFCLSGIGDLSMVESITYIAVSLVAYMAFMFIPYFFGRNFFELYVIKLFTRSFITGIFTIILFGGISLIVFTLNRLFEIRFGNNIYFDIYIACVGLFSSCFFFAGIPEKSREFVNDNYPKAFKVLLLYIIMPIISAYTVILYIYFVKILVTHSWPNGLVANLVLWYALISTIVIFFISTLKDENSWVKKFIFWFTKLIIPLLAMMFVSIGIRVGAYGITENRYFVIILGLWVLGIMAYLNLAKIKKNIIFLISLCLVAIISVFGPLSCFSVSISSQNGRFQNILNKYDMIQNNMIVPSPMKLSDTDMQEISEILNYFEYSHGYSELKYLPDNFMIGSFESTFGFSNSDIQGADVKDSYLIFSLDSSKQIFDIKGYDFMSTLDGYDSKQYDKAHDLIISYDSDNYKINITKKSNNELIISKNLLEIAKQLKFRTDLSSAVREKDMITTAEATFTYETSKIKIKLILQNISGYFANDSEKPSIDGFESLILIKLK